jgi:hypothetical protein
VSESLYLRDSISAPLIPPGTPVVGGYGDGRYLWPAEWWDLFPNAVKLVIVVSAAHIGDVLDVETGNATPRQVPAWVAAFNRAARRAATIYCDRDTWPAVIAALAASGIDPAGPRVDWWIGTLDGTLTPPVPPGGKAPVAVQYLDTGGYDQSLIFDPSWVGLEGPVGIGQTASDGDLVEIHHLMQVAIFGTVDPSGQGAFVDAVRAGTALNTVGDGWRATEQAQAHAAAMAALVATTSQVGDLVARVEALERSEPQPGPVAPHTHPVTTSGTSGAATVTP